MTLTFARDGSFVLDVTNDAEWLKHRLIPFHGSFADRVVLFVDGREVVPDTVEYLPPPEGPDMTARLATYRMRGRLGVDARTLRWFYGLPIDPYPLTIHRADGRIVVEEIAGDAWSRPIDVSGQFHAARINTTMAAAAIVGLLLVPLAIRARSALRR